MTRPVACWISAAVLAAVAAPALAAAPAPPQPDYHPSMGDLMTMAVQPRHIKLGVAGRQRNWSYATFEASELKNAFARIARTIPTYGKADTAAMMSTMIKDPLAALETAVKAHDARAFDTAYAEVTAACNACHEAQDHGFVVIKAPDGAAYPDQDFRPKPGR